MGRKNSCSGPFLEYKKIDEKIFGYLICCQHMLCYIYQMIIEKCVKKLLINLGMSKFSGYWICRNSKYFYVYCFNDPMFFNQ